MFIKLYIDKNCLRIPFSSRKIASSFARGFNGYNEAILQGTEYPCRDKAEQRGYRFAETISRYCEKYSIQFHPTRLEIHDDTPFCQSIFEGFE